MFYMFNMFNEPNVIAKMIYVIFGFGKLAVPDGSDQERAERSSLLGRVDYGPPSQSYRPSAAFLGCVLSWGRHPPRGPLHTFTRPGNFRRHLVVSPGGFTKRCYPQRGNCTRNWLSQMPPSKLRPSRLYFRSCPKTSGGGV